MDIQKHNKMKKLSLVLLFVLTIASAGAQDYRTSLGVRGGLPYGLSVKHFLGKKNAVEGIAASSYSGFIVMGFYEFEKWTGIYPGFNWYLGAGAHAGFWDPGMNPSLPDTFSGSVIGLDIVGGLEYTFDEIPLNLAIDIIPGLNLIGTSGWGGMNGAISIRYVF